MQLSNIALATILIALFATSSVECSTLQRSSYTGSIKDLAKRYEQPSEAAEKTLAEVEALKLKGEAIRSARLGSKASSVTPSSTPAPKSTLGYYPKPTPSATKARESVVRSSPSSSKSAESTGKPAQPPPKKPTITPQPKPKQPLQPKVSPAPNQATTSSQPAPGRSEHAPLIPPPGPPTMTPRQFEEQQQASQRSIAQASKATKSTASGVSSVAKLARTWGGSVPSSKPVSSTSSASPSKPSPQPTPGTSPEPVGPPPKVTSIPVDADFARFKEAIEQGKYTNAMYVVLGLPETSYKPYGKYLAEIGISKVIEIATSGRLSPSSEYEPRDPHYNLFPEVTMGLFLMHTTDEDFDEFFRTVHLKRDYIYEERENAAIKYAIEYGATISSDRFIRLFAKLPEDDQEKAILAAAKHAFKRNTTGSFDALVEELQSKKLLDGDSAGFFKSNAAFVAACRLNNLSIAKLFYERGRILSSMYAKAMDASYDGARPDNEVFDWLLATAGGDDLHIFLLEKGTDERFNQVLVGLKKKYRKIRHKSRYA